MKPPLRIHPLSDASVRHAREMRRDPTDAERKLWSSLRNRQIANLKFRRQHPMGPFIVDFCCIEKKLVIELDGSQHSDDQQYDLRRTEALRELGYRVIRFWNVDVLKNIEGVVEQIGLELSR
jgi:very-short-patch-repair endonuclease